MPYIVRKQTAARRRKAAAVRHAVRKHVRHGHVIRVVNRVKKF